MKIQKPEDLMKVKKQGSELLAPATARITVGAATCGNAKGALKVAEALRHELKKQKVKADVVLVGCNGMCFAEPIVEVIKAGKPRITYGRVKVDRAADMVKSVKTGKVIEDLALMRYDEEKPAVCIEPITYVKGKAAAGFAKIKEYRKVDFFKSQMKVVSRNAGTISPGRVEEYIALGGYAALAKALTTLSPQDVINEVTASKLRGRGGAGFPTGIKWDACRKAAGDRKYIVCNGSEGDPEIGMHRSFLESDPHAIIEGMALAGYAVGASEGWIYLNDRYVLAYERVSAAIKQAEQTGLLGDNIMGSTFSFTLKVKRGGGAYVCGEETALLNSLEGTFGEPRPRPPFPVQQGLFGKPTVVNNLETLANIPVIVMHGGKWFAGIGTPGSKGTKIVALSGSVAQPCWVEVPLGTTIESIIKTFGKSNGKKVKAFQTGGPSGGILPAKALKVKLDYDALAKQGSLLGSGGLLVMDEATDMVDMAQFFTDFFADESCGKCVPCREGVKRLQEIVETFVDGRGTKEHLALIKRMSDAMRDASFCALGKTAAVPLLSVMKHFPKELEKRMLKK
jgi:NADH:ubiquinone oxidoreductase subunit F (NADH-binding)/(2Fe-2S) ferredoxin